jgi:hypothetical protein
MLDKSDSINIVIEVPDLQPDYARPTLTGHRAHFL